MARFVRLALSLALLTRFSAAVSQDLEEASALDSDNECSAEGCALSALQLRGLSSDEKDSDLPPFVVKINEKLNGTVLPNLNQKMAGNIKGKNMDPMQLPQKEGSKMSMNTLNGLSTMHLNYIKVTGIQPPSNATGGLAVLSISLSGYFASNLVVDATMGRKARPVTFTFENVHLSTDGIQAFIDPATKKITKFEVPNIPVTIGGQSDSVGRGAFRKMIEKKIGGKLGEISQKMSGMLSTKITAAIGKMLEAKCPMNLS